MERASPLAALDLGVEVVCDLGVEVVCDRAFDLAFNSAFHHQSHVTPVTDSSSTQMR